MPISFFVSVDAELARPTDRSVGAGAYTRLDAGVHARGTSAAPMAIDRAARGAPASSRRGAPEMCRTAAQIFRDRGYDATSVSDVARALGMTKAGLYHHFESKEALLFEIMMYGLDRVRDEVIVPVRAIRDPEERLRQLIVRHARIATRGQRRGRAARRRNPRAAAGRRASRSSSGCASTSISSATRSSS